MSKQNPDVKSNFKECIQCMEVKAIEKFRKYYKGAAYYKRCKTCETINNKFLYLVNNDLVATKAEYTEVYNAFCEMYKETAALRPTALPPKILYHLANEGMIPNKHQPEKFIDECKIYITTLSNKNAVEIEKETLTVEAIKKELQGWLEIDLKNTTNPATQQRWEPEELDDIYDELKAKYRPRVGINAATRLPFYDETYKNELNAIIEKFSDYEDYLAESN